MSFDLTFTRVDGALPTEQELTSYFTKIPEFSVTKTDSGSQYWYANDETGVYCHFDFESKHEHGETLSFNLNYLRPSFFAHESMPLVVQLCCEFDLNVDDPQENTNRPAVLSELVESWLDHNRNAVYAMVQRRELDSMSRYYPEERATRWWQYSFARREIELAQNDHLFVPIVLLLELENEIHQVFVLANDVAQLLPKADFAIVVTGPERYGLLSYAELLDALGSLVSEIDTAIGPVQYVPHANVEEASVRIAGLTISLINPGDLTRVEADSFHNVAVTTG